MYCVFVAFCNSYLDASIVPQRPDGIKVILWESFLVPKLLPREDVSHEFLQHLVSTNSLRAKFGSVARRDEREPWVGRGEPWMDQIRVNMVPFLAMTERLTSLSGLSNL